MISLVTNLTKFSSVKSFSNAFLSATQKKKKSCGVYNINFSAFYDSSSLWNTILCLQM